MKAIVWTRYGPPEGLELREVVKPVPQDGELLIRVHATTVTAGDCEMRRLDFPLMLSLPIRLWAGFRRPTRVQIIGQELAGEIEAAGQGVTRFKVGDPVIGALGFGKGAYAEYVCVPAESGDHALAMKPANMSYEEAAALPVGGLEALHFLRQGELREGEKLLINGAGGSIGTIAVQLAKHLGAEVTGVDSAGKLEMLRSIGADHVIDYTREDFTKSGQTYDVILDVVGKSSFWGCMRALKEKGRYLLANPSPSKMLGGLVVSRTSGKKTITGFSKARAQDLDHLRELAEAGEIRTVIDRRFPLEQMVEAHRYVEAGGKKGNVVVTVA